MKSDRQTEGISFVPTWLVKFVVLLTALSVLVPLSQTQFPEPIQAQLIPEVQAIQPGKTFAVGLWLKMDEGWHTYWKNPGDSGLATRLTWNLPEGFEADDVQWPCPQKFETPTEMTYGYKDEVLLITDIHVPAKTKAGTIVKILARVDWLACKEECIPGHDELMFEIPIKEEKSRVETKWTGLFEEMRSYLPKKLSGWMVKALINNDRILINLSTHSWDEDKFNNIYFFSEQVGLIDYSANQKLKKVNNEYILEIQRSPYSSQPPSRLMGVLCSQDEGSASRKVWAMHIDVPLETAD